MNTNSAPRRVEPMGMPRDARDYTIYLLTTQLLATTLDTARMIADATNHTVRVRYWPSDGGFYQEDIIRPRSAKE